MPDAATPKIRSEGTEVPKGVAGPLNEALAPDPEAPVEAAVVEEEEDFEDEDDLEDDDTPLLDALDLEDPEADDLGLPGGLEAALFAQSTRPEQPFTDGVPFGAGANETFVGGSPKQVMDAFARRLMTSQGASEEVKENWARRRLRGA